MGKYAKPVIVGFIVAFVLSGGLSFLVAAGGGDAGMIPALVGGFFGVFTAYIMANLVGNQKGVAASAEEKAAAVAFRPERGKAMLIVMREGFVGKAVGLNVTVDGRLTAQLKSPRFTAIPLEVGSHEMEVAFGGLAGKQNKPNVERFGTGAGEVVVYAAKIKIGGFIGERPGISLPARPAADPQMLGGQLAQLFLQLQNRPVAAAVDVVFGGVEVGNAEDGGGEVREVHRGRAAVQVSMLLMRVERGSRSMSRRANPRATRASSLSAIKSVN